MAVTLGFIGMPGTLELLIVAGIVLLLFGNRLPGVMRSLGRGVVEFKKGIKDDDEDHAKISRDADAEEEARSHQASTAPPESKR